MQPETWERLARARVNGTQVAIVDALRSTDAPWTVAMLSSETGEPEHRVRHHVRQLESGGVVRRTGASPVAGTGAYEVWYGLVGADG